MRRCATRFVYLTLFSSFFFEKWRKFHSFRVHLSLGTLWFEATHSFVWYTTNDFLWPYRRHRHHRRHLNVQVNSREWIVEMFLISFASQMKCTTVDEIGTGTRSYFMYAERCLAVANVNRKIDAWKVTNEWHVRRITNICNEIARCVTCNVHKFWCVRARMCACVWVLWLCRYVRHDTTDDDDDTITFQYFRYNPMGNPLIKAAASGRICLYLFSAHSKLQWSLPK